MQDTKVLVFPRTVFGSAFTLLPWESVEYQLDEIERTFSWLQRPEAEQSEDMVQAIPCTIVKDSRDRYCLFRRVTENRRDLSQKLSLIIGGHIDEADDQNCFLDTMSRNLVREIDEEIGVSLEEPPQPVGVIIDGSSIVASRHVAFLHEMVAESVSSQALEEFSSKESKYTGKFVPASTLAEWRNQFDPWSRLVIEEYICPAGVHARPRQGSFI